MLTNIVHVSKRTNPYVQIDHTCLNDPRLSFKAKGILAYLLSKPPNWVVLIQDIVNHAGGEKEKSIRSGLQELAKFGYARLERGGDDGGSRWRIFETPQASDIDETAMSEGGGDIAKRATSPKPEFPISATLSNNKELVRRNRISKKEVLPPKFHTEFIAGWEEAFKEKFGIKYAFAGGKDGSAVKALSRLNMPAEELLEIAKKAWDHPKPFFAGISQTIVGFNSRINELRVAAKSGTIQEARPWDGYVDLNALERVDK